MPTMAKVEVTCTTCHTPTTLTMDLGGYAAWVHGVPIQHALPDLTVDERETLKLQLCKDCTDNLYNTMGN